MSWRPGRSGSFRRSGIHLDGSSFRLSSRHSDDDSATSKPSSASSFLRIRPSSGNTSDGEKNSTSPSNGTNNKSTDGGFMKLPGSRTGSFRSRETSGGTSDSSERSLGWRRSRRSPASSSTQQKTYNEPVTEADKSSTLPWSYNSYSARPATSSTHLPNQLLQPSSAVTQSEAVRRSSSVQPPGSVSPARPPSFVGSDAEETGSNLPSRTGSSASSLSGWSMPSPRLMSGGSTLSGSSTLPSKRKLQKVELFHLTEPSREMVRPEDVVVSGGEYLTATPVVTPIERLRRKDKEVARALEEKQKLIEEILHIPHTELESIAETPVAGNGFGGPKTAAEILLSTLSQAKALTALVNKSLKISEEEEVRAMASRRRHEGKSDFGSREEQQRIVAKGEKLVEITVGINKQLTLLLAIIQDSEKERDQLRRELARSQEQVKCLMHGGAGSGVGDGSWSSPLSPATSMISSPLSPVTPASISPLPSPLTSKSSSPPLSISEGAERHSLLSSLSSLSGFNQHRQT